MHQAIFPLQSHLQLLKKDKHKSSLYIKRDDMLHPLVSGNKWRKLKYNIPKILSHPTKRVLTFGGAFSNHIVAVAAAGAEFGFETIGVIRGEASSLQNPSLLRAQGFGMQLHFVDRSSYQKKDEIRFQTSLNDKFGDFYLLPEGGHNCLGVKGCTEIADEHTNKIDLWCLAAGTGTTACGVISSLGEGVDCLVFSALKGTFLEKEIMSTLLNCQLPMRPNQWRLTDAYSFGGYARYNQLLIDFMVRFYENYNVALDPIYTAKVAYGVTDLMAKGHLDKYKNIAILHTGGLQGVDGFNRRFGTSLPNGRLS